MRERVYKERTDHGPISLYHHDSKGTIFPCHWHDEYELLYFHKNTAILKIENQSYVMPEGSVAIVNPGELHTVASFESSGCRLSALVCKLSDVQEHYINLQDDNSLIVRIFETYQTQKNSYLAVKGMIYQLFYHLQTEDKVKPLVNSPAANQNMKRVLTYMEENYFEAITLEDMARKARFSKYHFIRVFKQYTDNTPQKFLNEIRISKAKEILKTGSVDITNTALQVGFENVSYFIKVFKGITGQTPLKYQKKDRQESVDLQDSTR
ncbi:MAG: hypothetical protein BGN88_01825 [Clostridiales bacterium 43-6]|nr:MAG: hypothetical protein BGN88_01825 [Clostridiales bacterium 43-6]